MTSLPHAWRSLGRRSAFGAAIVLGLGGGAHAQTAAAPKAATTPAVPPAPTGDLPLPAPAPTVAASALNTARVTASVYGFVELDLMHDSTQSFGEAITNNTMARPASYAGDNPRTQFTARDSRVGVRLAAPDYGVIKTSALVEADFFGNQAPGATEDATYSAAAVRLRQAFVKFQTPAFDVVAGHTHDLFGWGGAGFYPNTVAFLGVPGEVYHRDPQLRLTKTLASRDVSVEIALAAVRPAQRDGEIPDGQGGLRLAFNRWLGANAQGAGLPVAAPASLGVSGIYRHFTVPAFTAAAANPNKANAWGAAANLFLPVIPARGDDLGNTLSATAEATMGTGIANLYTGLTGGVLFPALPNPMMILPVPTYNPDIDEGLATYDAAGKLHTVNWRALVVGLQYRAPFAKGCRLSASVVGSQIQSNNVDKLTPTQGLPYVFSKAQYADGNVFFAPTPESQVGASVQLERQTFGDGVYGVNVRGELAVYYFF
ncbi:MAG TPA: hypothetical protein VH560_09015 [Polyangia bacterium]|nr:hypothetical protein [Polyangia bacterium]